MRPKPDFPRAPDPEQAPRAPETALAREQASLPSRIELSTEPAPFLRWVRDLKEETVVDLDGLRMADIASLVALAAISRDEEMPNLCFEANSESRVGGFALAVGLLEAVEGKEPRVPDQPSRSVTIRVVHDLSKVEPTAREIARLVAPAEEHADTRKTVEYVVIEILRNVVQHAHAAEGGYTAAQVMRPHNARPRVQVAVADSGIGVFRALSGQHDELVDARTALERALWPHYSGAFPNGRSGSRYNAGMGLFITSEMMKLLGGTMLLASRGAALLLDGRIEEAEKRLRFLEPPSDLGFPGTLVVFDVPLETARSFEALNREITSIAAERSPKRVISNWLSFQPSPGPSFELLVRIASENTVEAEKLATDELVPRLARGEAITLDFDGLDIVTQSFLHALLYRTIRVSWATQTGIHIKNASNSVRDSLTLLESYALGG